MTPPLHLTYDWTPSAVRGVTPGVSVTLGGSVEAPASVWTEILSRHITTRGASSAIDILASWSGSQRHNDGGVPRFRLLVDGAVVAVGVSATGVDAQHSSAILPHVEAVAAGRHTVTLECEDTIDGFVIDPTATPSTTPPGPGLGLFQAHLFAREVKT